MTSKRELVLGLLGFSALAAGCASGNEMSAQSSADVSADMGTPASGGGSAARVRAPSATGGAGASSAEGSGRTSGVAGSKAGAPSATGSASGACAASAADSAGSAGALSAADSAGSAGALSAADSAGSAGAASGADSAGSAGAASGAGSASGACAASAAGSAGSANASVAAGSAGSANASGAAASSAGSPANAGLPAMSASAGAGASGSGAAAAGAGASGQGAAGAGAPRPETWRVTFLGDSITETTCTSLLVYDALHKAGLTNFDFVGTKQNQQACGVDNPDRDVEGHSNYLVTDIVGSGPKASELPMWCAADKADVVLMHFGTNDAWNSGIPVENIVKAYSEVIAKLREAQPRVVVFVAQIIPLQPDGCADCPGRVQMLNAMIPMWASSLSTPESPIYVVDQWTGFDAAADARDRVHPNMQGSQKMADNWMAALKAHNIF